MQIFRLLLSLFMLNSAVFCTYAMEGEGEPPRDRKRDRISRAFRSLTMRPGRHAESTESTSRRAPFDVDDLTHQAPPNSFATLPPPEDPLNRLRKSRSDEGPGASEEHHDPGMMTMPI